MFTIYHADCIGQAGNCLYPNAVEITDKASLATVRGNHDRNEHFLGHYGLPNAVDGNWYFVHNGVLFIEIDSNVTDVVKHRNFINTALQTQHDWAILLMHHSMYSTSTRAIGSRPVSCV